MRVIAGTAKRFSLEAPDDKVRPTTDRQKETLFNIIQTYVYDAVVLDLFSGSGALGIETLSRGAKHCFFVDEYLESIKCTKKNLNHTKLVEKATVLHYDYDKACRQLAKDGQQFDLIFLDPPYRKGLAYEALNLINEQGLLAGGGIVVVETEKEIDIDKWSWTSLTVTRSKVYHKNRFTFVEEKGE